MTERDAPTPRTAYAWASPPPDLSLPDTEIHLWSAHLAASPTAYARLRASLSDEERARADRFRFVPDQHRSVVRRGALRDLLGTYLGLAPHQLAFEYSDRGKPRLATMVDADGLDFNLSHSHDLALLAFTRHRVVGVDVERLRPLADAMAIARRFFSPTEHEALTSLDPSQRTAAFFNGWTRKEAFVKATGEGLQRPLDSFDVSLLPGAPPQLLRWADGDAAEWTLCSVRPAVGFIGAIAAPRGTWTLRCWRWPVT